MVKALKKGVINRLKSIEQKITTSANHLKAGLEKEYKGLAEEKKSSDELFSDPFFGSIEENKKARIETCLKVLNESKEDGLFGIKIKAEVEELLAMNRAVSAVIEYEQDKIKIEEKLEKANVEAEQDEIKEDEEANKIISALSQTLSDEVQSQIKLKQQLNKGSSGIEELKQKLSTVEKLNSNKEITTAKIWSVFEDLKKDIGQQEKICKIILKTIDSKKERLIKSDLTLNFTELSKNISSEIEEKNNQLREHYKNLNLAKEDQGVRELYWLAKKKLELSKETILLLKQFEIKKMVFPSGNFAAHTCTKENAKKIITSGKLGEKISNSKSEQVKIGQKLIDLPFEEYFINDASSLPCEPGTVGFVFPLESIMKDHYFRVDNFKTGELKVFSKAPSSGDVINDIKSMYENFDILIKSISEKFKEWFEDAKKLDKKFVVAWDNRAHKEISKDFTKRWIKEESGSFAAEHKLSFDVIRFLVDERYLAASFNRLFMKTKGHHIEEAAKNKNDYLEEMQRMNKDEFISAVKLIKKSFGKIINEASTFLNKASTEQSITQGYFVAPSSQALYWEKYFEEIKNRPNMFYYEGEDIKKGMIECLEVCKKNFHDKKTIKTKLIRVYTYVSLKPLQTL